MPKQSAGLLLYKTINGFIEVFLVHPGGPFWARKDAGVWSIPKGQFSEGEDPLQAARREFHEETGFSVDGEFVPLRPVQQSAKIVHAWAIEGDLDPEAIRSNVFSIEWPPESGRMEDFPEVDRAAWFPLMVAEQKILKAQTGFLDQLSQLLRVRERSEVAATSRICL